MRINLDNIYDELDIFNLIVYPSSVVFPKYPMFNQLGTGKVTRYHKEEIINALIKFNIPFYIDIDYVIYYYNGVEIVEGHQTYYNFDLTDKEIENINLLNLMEIV